MSIHTLPNTPSSGSESPNPQPQTPLSPHQQNSLPVDPNTRRKPSRRANTAERRATHNAVERARRETLNGRFLDLAALLPNLASVRRPSKSAIVNSSIALIHTQRRSRATAGRELRNLKAETDLLRHQLNELRLASGLGGPPEEEPPRSVDFIALLNLEDEVEVGEDERVAYEMMEGDEDGMDGEDDLGDARYHQATQQQQFAPQHSNVAHMPRPPTIPTSAPSYDSPNSIYEPAALSTGGHSPVSDKLSSTWNYYPGASQQQTQIWAQHAHAAQAALFTPPSTSHGNAPPNPFTSSANQAFLANYHRQAQHQQQLQQHHQQQQQNQHALTLFPPHPAQAYTALSGPHGHQYLTHGEDDGSSVDSGRDSASGSPHNSQGSLPGASYDLPTLSSSVSSTSSGHSSIDAGQFAYNAYPRRPSVAIPAHGGWNLQMGKPSPPPMQHQATATPQQFAAMGLLIQ